MIPVKSKFIDVYAFLKEEEKFYFLFLKRSQDNRYPNTWHPVSGKIKENETAYEAALRELNEETSLKVISLWNIDYMNHFYYPVSNESYIYPCFAVEVKNRTVILNHEHSEYKWFDIEEAKSILIWRNHRIALEQLYEDICLKKHPSKYEFLKINLNGF